MNEPRPLNQIERWMQAVIMHPQGISAGVDSSEARAEIDVSAAEVEQVVERSRQLSAIERLQVYGNAYYARLLECLREEYPALRHAVGDEAFDALAFGYLQACPSQSYTLGNLGARFPQYLRDTRPNDDDDNGLPAWPDLLIDLATLERTYGEVFDGPGVEGETLLSADDLLAIAADAWEATRLVTVECLRLLRLRFPVHEYATAVKRGEEASIPPARPTYLAVSRRDYVVRRWELAGAELELLELLQQGTTVGEAIRRVAAGAETIDLAADELAERLREWFRRWTAAGFFRAIG